MSADALFVYSLIALAVGGVAWYLETHHGAQLVVLSDRIFRPREGAREQPELSTRTTSARTDGEADQFHDGSDLAK